MIKLFLSSTIFETWLDEFTVKNTYLKKITVVKLSTKETADSRVRFALNKVAYFHATVCFKI